MRPIAGSASYLSILIKTLTIAISNSISAVSIGDISSQSLNCSVSGDSFWDVNLTSPNASFNVSLAGLDANDKWHGVYELLGRKLCTTAVLVDAAHALAALALYDLLEEHVFVVDNYDEVQIRVTPFNEEFTRSRAAVGLYAAIYKMSGTRLFDSSRFTFFKGNQKMGKIEIIGAACPSGSCGANLTNASLPPVVSSNESALVATRSNASPSRSADPTLFDPIRDNKLDMELDCAWHGRRVTPRILMLAPSSLLTHSHIVKEDPMTFPP